VPHHPFAQDHGPSRVESPGVTASVQQEFVNVYPICRIFNIFAIQFGFCRKTKNGVVDMSSTYIKLVEYPACCYGFSYDLRKTNIIKNNTKTKENNMTMQSMDMFCNYKKVWYKNQINRSYG
jgi:hypothetical protein